MGKIWRPRPLEAAGVKDGEEVALEKKQRPRPPAKAPLEAEGVKDSEEVAPEKKRRPRPRRPAKAPLEAVGVKDSEEVALEKKRRPRPRRPAKAPLEAAGVKDAEGGVAVIAIDREVGASVLEAPVVAATRGGENVPLEDGTAVCPMESPVIATTRHEAVGVKDARGVVVWQMWRPRRPEKTSLEVVAVKDGKVDGKVVDALGSGALMVAAVGGCREKGPPPPLEDGIIAIGRRMDDALHRRAPVIPTTRLEPAARVMKDARGVSVAEGKQMWRPRRPPAKAPLKGVAVIVVDGGDVKASPVVEAALEYGTAVCLKMESLDGAPVIATTRQEAVVGVKDAQGVAPITVDGKVEATVPGPPVVTADGGGDKGPLEEGIVVSQVDTLDEAVGAKEAEEEVAVTTVIGEVEPLVAVAAEGGEKGSPEDGIEVCRTDARDCAPVIATDEKDEASVSVQEDSVLLPAADQKIDAPSVVVEGMPQAITVEGINGKEEKDQEGIKWLKHYSTAQSILIVGDGDFSFSLALATAFGSGGNLVATSPDSYGALTIKYGKAESNVRELKRLGATVLHGVDAETMKLHSYLEMRRFDRIVFNFPDAGFRRKEDQLHVNDAHQQLVRGFFVNAWHLLRPYGETHLSLKKGLPYDAWGIKKLAYESCLVMVRKVKFLKEDYPGYNQKRGDGVTCDDSFPLGPCSTFMFRVGDVEKLRQAGKRVGSISSFLRDRKFYPGISKKGSLEDGIVVCQTDARDWAPVIATDEKDEVSVQEDSVLPTVDQKIDAPVVEGMEAITMKGNGKEEKDKKGIKWLKHYSTAQSILIIGDGDFSFSLALATAFGSGGNLVATSLDYYGALTIKYGKAEANVRELKRLGATVLHGVDAETMKFDSYLEMRRFDRIVFNFPHAGFRGKEYQQHVIDAHKKLVRGFFANARHLLRPYGETHLSHKKGRPYDAWGIEELAYESCLIMVRKVEFLKEDYPGYNQKRGDGVTCDDSFPLGPCFTFMFRVGDIAATDMMWPFYLHPSWPQPHFPPVHKPIAFDPCPFGVSEMEDPFNCYGTSFHHQGMVQPTTYQVPIEQPWTPQGHQSLQREYEIHRQLTLSFEAHRMESVERQAMLEMLI